MLFRSDVSRELALRIAQLVDQGAVPGQIAAAVRRGWAARTRDAIDAVMPLLNAGHDVLLVAHAHVLRILTSQWLDVDPHFARLLRLDTAHYCVLSQYKGDNVIEHWNC